MSSLPYDGALRVRDYDRRDEDDAGIRRIANLDAERHVLGAMLLQECDDETRRLVLSILEPDHFFRDAHQVIFRAIRDLADAGKPIDAVMLADELDRTGVFERIGGDDYLEEVTATVGTWANATFHAEIVKQKALIREMQQAAARHVEDVRSQLFTPTELLDRFAGSVHRIEAESTPDEDDDLDGRLVPWPDAPDPAVWYGVAGGLVRAIEPHTEADPMAILGQVLVCAGNLFGRKPHWFYESTRHGTNLFMCLVGESSRARKGTSWNHVRRVFFAVDETWCRERHLSGLSTGEGLINSVRDPIMRMVRSDDGSVEEKEIDPGVDDKRALFVESEFGGLLSTMSRDGYNTSSVIRKSWDGDYLRINNKNTLLHATDPHISIIGHITSKELRKLLSSTEQANGFANRFLWVCSRRSKMLPHGGSIEDADLLPFVLRLQASLDHLEHFADPRRPLRRDRRADELWEAAYPRLSAERGDLVGDLTSRAEAQVMRLAAVHAVLDRCSTIQDVHLNAALAFWNYCVQSTAWIFGDADGDPESRAVVKELKRHPGGLTRTQINRRCFSGHKSAEDLTRLLVEMTRKGTLSAPSRTGPDGQPVHGRNWRLKTEDVPECARSSISEAQA